MNGLGIGISPGGVGGGTSLGFDDNIQLCFGDDNDVCINWNGNVLQVDAAAASLTVAFQEQTTLAVANNGNLILNPDADVRLAGNELGDVLKLAGTGTAAFDIRANLNLTDTSAQRLQLDSVDTVGDANIIVAYIEPTATESNPFFAIRVDGTVPLSGTLDANFGYARWDSANDGIRFYVNDAGTIRSSLIGTVEAGAVDPAVDMFISAASMKGLSTAGAGDASQLSESRELATNDINIDFIAFDQTTEQHAYFWFDFPKGWDEGTVTARYRWTSASGSGTAIWGIAGRSFSDDDALDQALGTEVTVTDTLLAVDDMQTSPESAAITFAGTPSEGDGTYIVVSRKAGSDSLNADAQLQGVRLQFKKSALTDA